MPADALRPTYEELVAENTALRERVAEVEQRNAQLQARLGEREAALKTALGQLEAARRAGTRQAAPLSKGPPKENPRRPGQKAGRRSAHREKPPQVDRTVEVTLAHATCLTCGGNLVDHTVQVQYQVEIPPVTPIVTQFNLESARGEKCGARFRAWHSEQTCTGHLPWHCAGVQATSQRRWRPSGRFGQQWWCGRPREAIAATEEPGRPPS